MITGRSSGSGQYSYESRSSGNITVHVSKMPEDNYSFRISLTHDGESIGSVMKMSGTKVQLLWAALNATAEKFGWKDFETKEGG